MRNIMKKFLTILILGSVLISCDKMLDVDSERVVFSDEYDLTLQTTPFIRFSGSLLSCKKLSTAMCCWVSCGATSWMWTANPICI